MILICNYYKAYYYNYTSKFYQALFAYFGYLSWGLAVGSKKGLKVAIYQIILLSNFCFSFVSLKKIQLGEKISICSLR